MTCTGQSGSCLRALDAIEIGGWPRVEVNLWLQSAGRVRGLSTIRAIHLSQVPPCFLGFGAKGGGPQARRRRDRVWMGASLVGRSRLGWRSGWGR